MLCWSRCYVLSVIWTWLMLLIKGHDHGGSTFCLLPVQQLQKPEPPMVLERSKELQENVKWTDDKNKQCPVGCTPRSNMMYPEVRGQHKSHAYSENCHRVSWKGQWGSWQWAHSCLAGENSLACLSVFPGWKADRKCFLISMINGILHDNYVYSRTDVLITRSLKTSNEL